MPGIIDPKHMRQWPDLPNLPSYKGVNMAPEGTIASALSNLALAVLGTQPNATKSAAYTTGAMVGKQANDLAAQQAAAFQQYKQEKMAKEAKKKALLGTAIKAVGTVVAPISPIVGAGLNVAGSAVSGGAPEAVSSALGSLPSVSASIPALNSPTASQTGGTAPANFVGPYKQNFAQSIGSALQSPQYAKIVESMQPILSSMQPTTPMPEMVPATPFASPEIVNAANNRIMQGYGMQLDQENAATNRNMQQQQFDTTTGLTKDKMAQDQAQFDVQSSLMADRNKAEAAYQEGLLNLNQVKTSQELTDAETRNKLEVAQANLADAHAEALKNPYDPKAVARADQAEKTAIAARLKESRVSYEKVVNSEEFKQTYDNEVDRKNAALLRLSMAPGSIFDPNTVIQIKDENKNVVGERVYGPVSLNRSTMQFSQPWTTFKVEGGKRVAVLNDDGTYSALPQAAAVARENAKAAPAMTDQQIKERSAALTAGVKERAASANPLPQPDVNAILQPTPFYESRPPTGINPGGFSSEIENLKKARVWAAKKGEERKKQGINPGILGGIWR